MIKSMGIGFAGGLAVAVWAFSFGYRMSDLEHEELLLKVENANRVKQIQLIQNVNASADKFNEEQVYLERRLAGASAAVDRLLEEVRDANVRADAASGTESDASRARTLLAQCASKYRDVAQQADKLRANVIGLQAYAKAVSTK